MLVGSGVGSGVELVVGSVGPEATAAQKVSMPFMTLPVFGINFLILSFHIILYVSRRTIVGRGAIPSQADLTVALDGVDGGADASVVALIASGVLVDGLGDTRGSAGRDVVSYVDGGGDGRKSRKNEHA